MSRMFAAPSIASQMAWISTSASLWPNSPRLCSIFIPPSQRSRPSTSLCTSKPMPTLILSAGAAFVRLFSVLLLLFILSFYCQSFVFWETNPLLHAVKLLSSLVQPNVCRAPTAVCRKVSSVYLRWKISFMPSISNASEKRKVWSRGFDLAVAITYPTSSENTFILNPAPNVKYLRLPLFSASW